jgi:glucose/mannose transport system substrate-binding protein
MSKKLWYTLFTLFALTALVLTACSDAAPEEPAMAGQVEVFSWWTGGGEAAGLDAMIEIFDADYADIEFINAAVAGGAGTNARENLTPPAAIASIVGVWPVWIS